MKKPSHRDRLIASLPADLQAGAMEACHNISDDGNDPVEGLFAVDIEATQRGFEKQHQTTERSTAQLLEEIRFLREKLAESVAESEKREKQLPAHITQCNTETQKTVNEGFQNITGDKPWRRGITKSIVNGIVWVLSVVAATTVIQYYQLKNEIAPLREMAAEFRTINKNLAEDPKALAEYAKYSKEANSEALLTSISIHAISKLMSFPKMTMYRTDDGFLTIAGPKSFLLVGSDNERNWFKFANPASYYSPNTTPAIDNAKAAEKKLNQK